MAQNRTPLRYPGGKQKLTPFVLEIIKSNDLEGGHYAEPYAGGAGVAMELLVDKHVSHIHLNDSSYHIYCFWKSLLNNTDNFCASISRSQLNIDEWLTHREILRNPNNFSEFEVGFATFYLNRTNRSGVLKGGVIGGLDQSGKWKIDARFSRIDLIKRVELIAAFKDSISIYNQDAELFFKEEVSKFSEQTLVYCDPPYYEKASGLYLNHYAPDDHERIANIIQNLNIKWMVSYDGVEQILSYYKNKRKFLYQLQYNAARSYKGNEVFIFSDDLVIPRRSSLSYISEGLQKYSDVLHGTIAA